MVLENSKLGFLLGRNLELKDSICFIYQKLGLVRGRGKESGLVL